MEYRKLSELKKLPNNPRLIKDRQFKILCQSIQDNKEYFEARPIILSDRTGELIIIAGNMRYEAARKVGLKQVPTFLIKSLTEEKEKEIIIRDNVSNGEFDWDCLANSWDSLPLNDWGVDVPGEYLEIKTELTKADFDEDKSKLTKFIEEREKGRERGQDKTETNFWLCMVFQSHEQKHEFLNQVNDVPNLYGMYIDGQSLAEKLKIPIAPNNQKIHTSPLDKKLIEMVIK